MDTILANTYETQILKKLFNADNLFVNNGNNRSEDEKEGMTSNIFKESVLIEYLQFLIKQGLKESKMEKLMTAFYQLLKDTVFKKLPVDDAIVVFNSSMISLSTTNLYHEHFLKSMIDYILENIFKHYHLLLTCCCYQRPLQIHTSELNVQVLPANTFTPLADSISLEQWEAEEKVKLQEKIAKENKEKLEKEAIESKLQFEEELASYLNDMENICGDELTVSDISDLVKSIIQKHGDITTVDINTALERSKQTITHKCEMIKLNRQMLKSCSPEKSPVNIRNKKDKRRNGTPKNSAKKGGKK